MQTVRMFKLENCGPHYMEIALASRPKSIEIN